MRKDNKTIGITVRFFTNDLPLKVGNNETLFWEQGSVQLEANKSRGLKAQSIQFKGMGQIEEKMRGILKKAKLRGVSVE